MINDKSEVYKQYIRNWKWQRDYDRLTSIGNILVEVLKSLEKKHQPKLFVNYAVLTCWQKHVGLYSKPMLMVARF